jgi:ABC-2 type transport system permease protein
MNDTALETEASSTSEMATSSANSGGADVGLLGPTLTLWRREMVGFFRQRNRVVSALITPVLFWLMLGSGLNSSFNSDASSVATTISETAPQAEAETGYLAYFFPGTISMILLFTAIFSTITVIEDRKAGFLQGVLVSPAPRLSIVLGKVFGGASIAMIHGLIFLIIWPFVGDWPGIGPILLAIVIMFVMSIALTTLGVCIAWPMDSTAGFHAIMMVFLMPMWFLSGAVFPVGTAPLPLKVAMYANPLTYGQELLAACLSNGEISIGLAISPAVAAVIFGLVTALLLALSVRLVSRPRKDGLP